MDRKHFLVVPVSLLPTLVSDVLDIRIHYLSDSQQVPYLPVDKVTTYHSPFPTVLLHMLLPSCEGEVRGFKG